MSATRWETSFGAMTVTEAYGHTVEVLRFDREGKDHTHDVWEYAVCLEGPCDLVFDHGATSLQAAVGRVYRISPGRPHRMRPTTDKACVWLVWYAGEEGL